MTVTISTVKGHTRTVEVPPFSVAPEPGCTCDVCVWCRTGRVISEDTLADLEENYQRFLAGDLVSRSDRD